MNFIYNQCSSLYTKMDMFKTDSDCDPEDARFERLDGTDGSAEIKQFVPIFEASHCHSHGVLF